MSEYDFDQKTIDVVNALFEKFPRIKPAFKQAWPTDYEFQMAKREWLGAFYRANVTSINRIKRGIERLADSPKAFIPSPGEFLSLCKVTPQDIGAPPMEQAYREACEKAHPCYGEKFWSHEAVKHAYLKSGPYFLRSESIDKTKPVFKSAYLEACEEIAEGRNLNQIENGKPDTPENRIKYQDFYGPRNNLTPQQKIEYYKQWLRES